MKMMKKISFALMAVASVMLMGCLKDNGNILTSYGVGTIKQTAMGTKYIQFDDSRLCIQSEQINPDSHVNQRVFTGFTINWDEQPASANQDGIYAATLNGEADYFTVGECNAFSEQNNAAFSTSDSLLDMSTPYITYLYDKVNNIITFQTAMYETETGQPTLQLMKGISGLHEEGSIKTDTLLLVFDQGNIKKTSKKYPWKSFHLPYYHENVTIVFKIKAHNLSFNATNPKGTDYYTFNVQYTKPEEN